MGINLHTKDEDSGVQRIMSMIDNRFDRMEDRLVKLSDQMTQVLVISATNTTEINNIKTAERTQTTIRWAMVGGIVAAITGTILNWFGKGGKS